MECLDSVVGLPVAGHWRFSFELAYDVVGSGDSVVFAVEPDRDTSWELSLRVERGAVVDVAVWDAVDLLRVGLPFGVVELRGRSVDCTIPQGLIVPQRATARVLLNGAIAGASAVDWTLDRAPELSLPRELASA